MVHPRRAIALGLAFSLLGLTASTNCAAQDAKKEKGKESISLMDKALEQSKLTGLPVLAVAGSET